MTEPTGFTITLSPDASAAVLDMLPAFGTMARQGSIFRDCAPDGDTSPAEVANFAIAIRSTVERRSWLSRVRILTKAARVPP